MTYFLVANIVIKNDTPNILDKYLMSFPQNDKRKGFNSSNCDISSHFWQ